MHVRMIKIIRRLIELDDCLNRTYFEITYISIETSKRPTSGKQEERSSGNS